MMNSLDTFSKEFIETGKVPIKEILKNSVYYPACYSDGGPVKFFNENLSEYGIQSFIYVDYAMSPETLTREQETFAHYHVFACRDLQESDLITNGWNPSKYEKFFSPEEITRQREVFKIHGINPSRAFGRWIVYERDEDASSIHGPEKFSFLYLCADGMATYAALFCENGIAPKVLAIIRPGTGWGGNYVNFYDPNGAFMKIIRSGKKSPESVFFGDGLLETFEEFLNSNR